MNRTQEFLYTIIHRIVSKIHKRYCCNMWCFRKATWNITGSGPEDSTDSCEKHVGYLCIETQENRVVTIK